MQVRNYIISDSPGIKLPVIATWPPINKATLFDHVEQSSPRPAQAEADDASPFHCLELLFGGQTLLLKQGRVQWGKGTCLLSPLCTPHHDATEFAVFAAAHASNLRKVMQDILHVLVN